MEMVAPAGPMFQVVTLSGNTLTMTSGTHSLKDWRSQEVNKDLDKITGTLVQVIFDVGKKAAHAICGGYISRMFVFFFTEGPLYKFWDAKKSDTAKFERFYSGMLEQGIYFAPSNFEAAFVSLANSTYSCRLKISKTNNSSC